MSITKEQAYKLVELTYKIDVARGLFEIADQDYTLEDEAKELGISLENAWEDYTEFVNSLVGE